MNTVTAMCVKHQNTVNYAIGKSRDIVDALMYLIITVFGLIIALESGITKFLLR